MLFDVVGRKARSFEVSGRLESKLRNKWAPNYFIGHLFDKVSWVSNIGKISIEIECRWVDERVVCIGKQIGMIG